jgi:hypothetical protein
MSWLRLTQQKSKTSWTGGWRSSPERMKTLAFETTFGEIDVNVLLKLKGSFIVCPFCVINHNARAPVRQGQVMCVRQRCRAIIDWKSPENQVSGEAAAIGPEEAH